MTQADVDQAAFIMGAECLVGCGEELCNRNRNKFWGRMVRFHRFFHLVHFVCFILPHPSPTLILPMGKFLSPTLSPLPIGIALLVENVLAVDSDAAYSPPFHHLHFIRIHFFMVGFNGAVNGYLHVHP